MLASSVLVAGAFAPWLIAVTHAVSAKGGLGPNLGWIPKPGLGTFTWLFVNLAGCADFPKAAVWLAALSVLPAVLAVWSWGRNNPDSRRVLLLVFLASCSAAIAFAASSSMAHSIWGDRHLVFAAPPLIVAIVLASCRARWPYVRKLALLAAAVWFTQASLVLTRGEDKKVPWDSFIIQVLEREGIPSEPVTFFAVDRYLHYPFDFYFDVLKNGRSSGFARHLTASEGQKLQRIATAFNVRKSTSLDEAHGGHFWVGYSTFTWHDSRSPESLIGARGCRVGADVVVSDRFHTLTAFPVWCGAGSASK
jgi:hypothetical protein